MNNHQFLVSEREQGRYDEYMRRGLIGLNLNEWIYTIWSTPCPRRKVCGQIYDQEHQG